MFIVVVEVECEHPDMEFANIVGVADSLEAATNMAQAWWSEKGSSYENVGLAVAGLHEVGENGRVLEDSSYRHVVYEA